MQTIFLSELNKDDTLYVEGGELLTVEDLIDDIDFYRDKCVYTTTKYHANLNALSMIETEIQNEQENMYEDWADYIIDDISQKDINDIQEVLDRILSKNPDFNISYHMDKLVIIDID